MEAGGASLSQSGYRRPLLLKQIEAAEPDVLCLQECDDFAGFWKKQLAAHGYESVYQQRNGKKPRPGVALRSVSGLRVWRN